MKTKLILLILCTSFISACVPTTPSLNDQINIAVQQTVAAFPTYTPNPPPVILPSSTFVNLAGLFCEYQFCIGHPVDMAFFDLNATRNQATPSTASQGLLLAYNANSTLVIEIAWQDSTGITDPQFMINSILDAKVDTRSGNLDPILIGNLNVLYVPINFSGSALLPNGGVAAWICGNRAFAWKAYTPQPDLPKNLLFEAIQDFRCNK